MSGNIWGLLPVFLFMMAMLAVSIYLRNAALKKSSGNFLNEYFTGSRSLGGFVLAMTTVATYSSVSSFVGGPGQAWDIGFGWIYMSVVQVTALFLVLGILGKKNGHRVPEDQRGDGHRRHPPQISVRCAGQPVGGHHRTVLFRDDGRAVCGRRQAV